MPIATAHHKRHAAEDLVGMDHGCTVISSTGEGIAISRAQNYAVFFYRDSWPMDRSFVYLVLRRLSNLERFLEIPAGPGSDLHDEAHRCRKYATRIHFIDGLLGRPWNAVHHIIYVIANRKPRIFCGFNGSFERNEICRSSQSWESALAILIPIGARDLFTRAFASLRMKCAAKNV